MSASRARMQKEISMQQTLKVLQSVPFVAYWHASKPGDFAWSSSNRLASNNQRERDRVDLLRATAWFTVDPTRQEYIKQFAYFVLNAPNLGQLGAEKFRAQYDYAFSPFATKEYRDQVIARALALQGKGPLLPKNIQNHFDDSDNDSFDSDDQKYPDVQSSAPRRSSYMNDLATGITNFAIDTAASATSGLDRFINGQNGSVLETPSPNNNYSQSPQSAGIAVSNIAQQASKNTKKYSPYNFRESTREKRITSQPGPDAEQAGGKRLNQGTGAQMSSANEHETTAAELWDSVKSKLPLPAKLLLTSQLGLGIDPSDSLKQLKTRNGKVDYSSALGQSGKQGQVLRSSGLGAPAYRQDKRLSPDFASALLTVHSKLPKRQRKPFERLVETLLKDLADVQSHSESRDPNAEAASLILRLGLLNCVQTLGVSQRVQTTLASHLS